MKRRREPNPSSRLFLFVDPPVAQGGVRAALRLFRSTGDQPPSPISRFSRAPASPSSRPKQAAFSCARFVCAACVAEGPWQYGNLTDLDETKPTIDGRRFFCPPDRSALFASRMMLRDRPPSLAHALLLLGIQKTFPRTCAACGVRLLHPRCFYGTEGPWQPRNLTKADEARPNSAPNFSDPKLPERQRCATG